MADVSPLQAGSYRAFIERKLNPPNNRLYYRYAITTNLGKYLFDGAAGDVDEAVQTIKAHLRRLQVHPPAIARTRRLPLAESR